MKPGKQFEKDFEKSCKKVMTYLRFNDPASSFNIECNNCPKKKTRFASRHLCDAVAYYKPYMYLFELKSTKGKSIPFKNIVKNDRDKRLQKMVDESVHGCFAYVIINFRSVNKTYAVSAPVINDYIKTNGTLNIPDIKERSSIPISVCSEFGDLISQKLKRVHYSYDILSFLELE